MRVGRLVALIGIAVLEFAAACEARAQDAATLRGTVTDAATSRPVIGAIVRLGPVGNQRVTRTDETGGFVFGKVPLLSLSLDVRALGYEMARRTIEVTTEPEPIAISLTRLTTLDTITVRAAKQGLYGVVAAASDLRPIAKATLQIAGKGRIKLDSTGHFFVPVDGLGTYMLRARAPGYEPQTLSVIVSPNEGLEVALLLDSASKRTSNRLEVAFQDFDQRYKEHGSLSAVVPRSELMRDAGGDLVRAIRYAPAFTNKNMRFGSAACVFVDGIAKATLSLAAFSAEEIEAVEVYGPNGKHSDRTGTLAHAWPRGFPCPPTGFPRVHPGDDVVQWVVVWIKH